MTETAKFETWGIVEVMGHRRFAGYVSEQAVGGASFIRVDVPTVQINGTEHAGFTKLLGAGSIYAISPCTEETARAFAAQDRSEAFSVYEAPRLPALPASGDRDEDDDEWDEDEDDSENPEF